MTQTPFVNSSNQRNFSLTTYDKTNTSPSQAKFTFSKANRFPKIKKNCPVSCYDMPGTFSARAASLGYGKKRTFNDNRSKFINQPLLNFLPCRLAIARQIQTEFPLRQQDRANVDNIG